MTKRNTPLQSLKGMDDILPDKIKVWQEIEKRFRTIFENWNFQEIRTPILEPLELFKRSIGEETDIVSKEMFAFKDRGDRDLVLRPEVTASVVRSCIQNRLAEGRRSLGLYYWGPMYRAERPQKGRKREFYQAGCELFGPAHPFQDVVLLTLVDELFKSINLSLYQLKINHLGTKEERAKYLKTLKNYLADFKDQLSPDSQRRLDSNVLRIFDSKIESDIKITEKAPKLVDALGEKSRGEFKLIQEKLDKIGISYTVEPRIVRGLDYYTGFVFEVTHPALGAQDAIGAGGRYDDLVELLGGASTGASGFALGIERILLSLEAEKKSLEKKRKLVYFGALSPDYFDALHNLRIQAVSSGIETEADYLQTALKKHLGTASKLNAAASVILGEAEMKKSLALVKNMATGEQKEVPFSELKPALQKIVEAKS